MARFSSLVVPDSARCEVVCAPTDAMAHPKRTQARNAARIAPDLSMHVFSPANSISRLVVSLLDIYLETDIRFANYSVLRVPIPIKTVHEIFARGEIPLSISITGGIKRYEGW